MIYGLRHINNSGTEMNFAAHQTETVPGIEHTIVYGCLISANFHPGSDIPGFQLRGIAKIQNLFPGNFTSGLDSEGGGLPCDPSSGGVFCCYFPDLFSRFRVLACVRDSQIASRAIVERSA